MSKEKKTDINFKDLFDDLVIENFNQKLLRNQVTQLPDDIKIKYLKFAKQNIYEIIEIDHIDQFDIWGDHSDLLVKYFDEIIENRKLTRSETSFFRYIELLKERIPNTVHYPFNLKHDIINFITDLNELIEKYSNDPEDRTGFNLIKYRCDNIPDLKEKLKYLLKTKTTINQSSAKYGNQGVIDREIIRKIDLEIDLINKEMELNQDQGQDQGQDQVSTVKKKYNIRWNDTFAEAEFLELCKALRESGAIMGTQKDIIMALSELLNIKIDYPDQQLQSMYDSRNNYNRTIFIDKLRQSLIDFLDKRDEKKLK